MTDTVAILMGGIVLLFVLEGAYGISLASAVNGVANALNPLNAVNAAVDSAGQGFAGIAIAVAIIALMAYGLGFAVSTIGFESLLMAGAFMFFLLLLV